jgi:SAM-dependent methyltransferase
MSVGQLREVIGRLGPSAHALSVIGAALRARAAGAETAPELQTHVEDVLTALGVRDALPALSPAAARPMLAEIRMLLHQGLGRLDRAGKPPGWNDTDAELLQAAGDVSSGFPTLLQRFVPTLPGLAERLGAAAPWFLDVGVGVAALSIEMARLWPSLRVVGIDVWAPSLALARQNVRSAGLDGRVELREQAVQDLTESGVFDVAWIPSAFIPGSVLPEAVRRVRRSLREGGWLIFASLDPGGDPLAAALTRLRTAEWGAAPWSPSESERLLAQSGFHEIRALPSPPGSAAAFVAGRVVLSPGSTGDRSLSCPSTSSPT